VGNSPHSYGTSVTCRKGSHKCYLPPTQVNAPHPRTLGPALTTYIHTERWFTQLQTVTYPSINRARLRATALINANALPPNHATIPNLLHSYTDLLCLCCETGAQYGRVLSVCVRRHRLHRVAVVKAIGQKRDAFVWDSSPTTCLAAEFPKEPSKMFLPVYSSDW